MALPGMDHRTSPIAEGLEDPGSWSQAGPGQAQVIAHSVYVAPRATEVDLPIDAE